MAYVEIEITKDKLPESFNCELYIQKKGGEISCTCINTDTRFGSAVDGCFHNEEFALETLLDLITVNILGALGID